MPGFVCWLPHCSGSSVRRVRCFQAMALCSDWAKGSCGPGTLAPVSWPMNDFQSFPGLRVGYYLLVSESCLCRASPWEYIIESLQDLGAEMRSLGSKSSPFLDHLVAGVWGAVGKSSHLVTPDFWLPLSLPFVSSSGELTMTYSCPSFFSSGWKGQLPFMVSLG